MKKNIRGKQVIQNWENYMRGSCTKEKKAKGLITLIKPISPDLAITVSVFVKEIGKRNSEDLEVLHIVSKKGAVEEVVRFRRDLNANSDIWAIKAYIEKDYIYIEPLAENRIFIRPQGKTKKIQIRKIKEYWLVG